MSLAFVFPGQGSQSVGMLSSLAAASTVVGETFDEASEALGYDLWGVTQSGPEESLNRTEVTQPALLTAAVALWRVWRSREGAEPVMLAGHSLGEYSALVVANALVFAHAVPLVETRGRYMQAAVPEGTGAMAAIIGLDESKARALCEEVAGTEVLEPVNLNAPGQIVLAGHASAVERALGRAKAHGAKRAVALPVSVPSHCSLMRPAAERLETALESVPFAKPERTVLHNVDVQAHDEPDAIRAALTAQLHSPVRWVETVEALGRAGITRIVECGPGKVLTGLVRRIDPAMEVFPMHDPDTLDRALDAVGREG